MDRGKVLMLYMTMPDMMRSGHRMQVSDLECDHDGIVGDVNYDTPEDTPLVLVSKKSYDIIEEAELFVDKGVLMENIYTDLDLYHLKAGSVIEIGETMFEVNGPCEAYGYLYGFAPELPDLIRGQRGLYITPIEYGRVNLGDEISVLKEAE